MNKKSILDDMIKEMAKTERLMDEKKIPFVSFEGKKFPVSQELMDRFGLTSGQSINTVIFFVIKQALMDDFLTKMQDELKAPSGGKKIDFNNIKPADFEKKT